MAPCKSPPYGGVAIAVYFHYAVILPGDVSFLCMACCGGLRLLPTEAACSSEVEFCWWSGMFLLSPLNGPKPLILAACFRHSFWYPRPMTSLPLKKETFFFFQILTLAQHKKPSCDVRSWWTSPTAGMIQTFSALSIPNLKAQNRPVGAS